jgi:hypothetical protein
VAIGGVDSGSNIDRDLGVIGIGITLAGERLDVALAVLIDVIGDPGFLPLPARGSPTPSPD